MVIFTVVVGGITIVKLIGMEINSKDSSPRTRISLVIVVIISIIKGGLI